MKFKMRKFNYLLIIALIAIVFFNCKKEDAEVETIIKKDTVYISVHDTIITQIPADSGTVIFLVRHAETDGGGSNPHLSAIGLDRADQLLHVLRNNPIEAVFSTSFFRTSETAAPLASEFGLNVITYDASKLKDLSITLSEDYIGKRILVVGHSNTTPELINFLTNTNDYKQINDTVYDNLFIVNKNSAESLVTHLKY